MTTGQDQRHVPDRSAQFLSSGLVQLSLKRVLPILKRAKKIIKIGVIHRFARVVGNQVLFGHVSHIKALLVLGQKVVERLVFLGTAFLGDRVIPRIRVRKHGVHIKDHTPERVFAVAYNLPQMIFRARFEHSH